MSIRLGILGFAHGHVGTYCGQWLKLPHDQVEVVCGWDHDPARAADAAEKFGLAIDSGIASPPSHGDRIAALAPEILAFLQGSRPAIATAAEGRDVLAMTLASCQSSNEGRRINL